MNLIIPPEPKELKSWMTSLKSKELAQNNVDWDSYIVWAGNRLPKYFWDAWKAGMKPSGFTWQKFLKLLGHRTDIVLMWYKGHLPWQQFVAKVLELIDSPLGKELQNR